MARGIFTRFAAIDAFTISFFFYFYFFFLFSLIPFSGNYFFYNQQMIYAPVYFQPIATKMPMFFVVCHLIPYVLVVLLSTLIWPQLSSNQFMLELRYCTRLCRELFLLLSLKLDTEIIPHNSDEGDKVKLLGFNHEKDLDKRIKYLEYEYLSQFLFKSLFHF